MAILNGNGFPDNALGNDGDLFFAQDIRFYIGPKASGVWPKNYLSALPPPRPGFIFGVGAPTAAIGGIGNAYVDLSTNNTWGPKTNAGWGGSPIGNYQGAQGVAGPSGQSVPSLNSLSNSFGPLVSNTAALPLSSGTQVIPAPGTTQPGYFTPLVQTTMVGAMMVLSSANSPGATTFTLVDVTAGSGLYSYRISTAGTVANQTGLSVGLTPGNLHQWQVSGSGNAFVQALPTFQMPSSLPVGLSYGPLFGTTFNSAPSTTTALLVAGSTAGVTQYMGVAKTGIFWGGNFVNTSGSNASFGLFNSGGTQIYSVSIPPNGGTPTTIGPIGPSGPVVPAGYYTWRVACSSSGYFSVQPQFLT